MADSLYVRARVALAVAAREAADQARGIVGDVSTPMRAGERIRKARRLRMQSLSVTDLAVLAELADGATWDQIAEALSMDREACRRQYEPTWRQWLDGGMEDDSLDFGDFTVGYRGDDLETTVDALDQWWRRHTEPWDTADPAPVAQVLVDGQTPPSDS